MKNHRNARKYITYNALMLALRKSKVSSFGTVATILIETFLENEGRLLAAQVVARGICEEGKFRDWRKELIDKEWLKWSEIQTDKGQYFPGKRLVNYINKEKIATKEMATKDEVLSKNEAATKVEVQVLRNEINQIKDSMEKIYDKMGLGPVDPPGYTKLLTHADAKKIN
jgi:hypothetical protein